MILRVALSLFIGVAATTVFGATEHDWLALIQSADSNALQQLIQTDSTWVAKPRANGMTPLHYAAALNQAGAVDVLVGAGADVNACRSDGNTPLHVAAAMNAPAAVIALLVHHANPLAQAGDGATPLILAARRQAYGAGAALLTLSPVAYVDTALDARTPAGAQCVKRGDMDILHAFLEHLLRDRSDESVKFAFGMTCLSKHDYPRAELMFEDIVTQVNPGNARARLELAQTYMAQERYVEARRELSQLLRAKMPNDTRQIVEADLKQLQNESVGKRGTFSGRVDGGVMHDSNVNVGPDSLRINISPIVFGSETITSLSVDEASQPKSTTGGFLMLTLDGLYDVGDWGSWVLTMDGSFYANTLSSYSEYETRYYQGMVGFKKSDAKSMWQIPAFVSHIDRGGAALADIIGCSPSWTTVPSFMMAGTLATTVGVESRNYVDLNDRDSGFMTVIETWEHPLAGDAQHVQISASLQTEKANADIYSSDGGSFQVRDDWSLDSSLVLYAAAKYTYAGYKEQEALATSKRADKQVQVIAGVTWSMGNVWGCDLNFVETDNQSSFDLYTYNRGVLTVSAYYSF